MTAQLGTMSVDGTPISRTDLARIQAEDALHSEQQRKAVRIVAAAATDVDDARMLLSILGLGDEVVSNARAELAPAAPADLASAVVEPGTPTRPPKRSAAA